MRKLFVFFGLSSLVILQAMAEQTRSSGSTLSLNIGDAIQMALEQNPDVLNNKERLLETDKNISYSYAQALPTLNGVATAARQKDAANGTPAFGGKPYNQYKAQVTLDQPLYVGGATSAAISSVKKEREIREKTLSVTERDLTLSVIEAFYTMLVNQKQYEILNKTLSVQQESLNTAQKYFKIGRGQLIDVLQMKTQVALLLPKISTAENQRKTALSQLMTLLHQNQMVNINLVGSLDIDDTSSVMKFVENKKELPEITRSKTQISQFQDQKVVTLASHFPKVDLVGNFTRSAHTSSDLLNDYSSQWSVGLQLNIPLFSGLSSIFQRKVLYSQEQQMVYSQEKLFDTLSYNQVQAERNLEVARTVLESSKNASSYAEASLKQAQHDYSVHNINYMQLLTSQQNFLEAESTYAMAKYSYIDAVAKFFVATGIPLHNLVAILVSK